MDIIKESLPQLKAVKKTTYNSIINHSYLNPENTPFELKNTYKSQSFKKITNFVPKLGPKKSTFVPSPLKLNIDKKHISEKEDDYEKQMTGDEIKIIDSSSSSFSSSDINLSDDDSENKTKEYKNTSLDMNVKFESDLKEISNESDSFYLDVKNIETNENMKILRKKMCQIRIRIGSNKFKEAEEVIHDDFKNNFDIGLKKYEKEKEVNWYGSVNLLQNKENIKPKCRSIFEVISLSKGNKKK